MLIFNLPQRTDPVSVSRGIDKDRTRVRPPKPAFVPRPFKNYMAMPYNDESLMGYGPHGTFTATTMMGESQRQAFSDMRNNSSIISMINDKRRGRI